MATWHTDYLLGNDTTGDGSAAFPFQKISKAYSVAAAGDTVKVAGSTLSDVPGLTLSQTTAGSNTFFANIDVTGILAPGDCISLTEPGFGVDGQDKFFFKVASISGTTVNLNIQGARTGVDYAVRKFNQVHYYTTVANTIFESGVVQPADIQLLGGWNSDFTVQDGWTVVCNQSSTTPAVISSVFTNIGANGDNTYREKFAFFSMSTAFGGSTNFEYWGDIIVSRTVNICGGKPLTLPGSTVKWYISHGNFQVGTTTLINADGTYGMVLDELWVVRINTTNNTFTNGSFRANNIYYLIADSVVGVTTGASLAPSTWGGSFGNVYCCVSDTDRSIRTTSNARQFTWDGGLYFTDSDNLALSPGIGQLMWTNPTQNVDNFKWWYSTNSALWYSTPATVFIKDIEGDKLITRSSYMMTDSTEYVTGSNSLKLLRMQYGTGQYAYPPIAQFNVNPSTTALNITITAKTSGPTAVIDQFRIYPVGYQPDLLNDYLTEGQLQYTQIIDNIDWTTFTITITDVNLINLLKGQTNILTWRNTLIEGGYTYLWIDDVVVTQS